MRPAMSRTRRKPRGTKQDAPRGRRSTRDRRRAWLASAAIAVVTLLVFSPVRHFDFVNYDDLEFVVENPHVASGLSAEDVRWAFANPYTATGGPVTWLSHMLDVEMWGLAAGGHHVTSVVLHAVNAALLLLILWRLTGALGRSVVVSALFALHPLHVESVAWISQRKDVLSTLFWLLTMWTYASYARKPSAGRYVVVAACFALGLLSKPMVVTLPFVLLLLDWWPLGRISSAAPLGSQLLRLSAEKVPLAVMSAIAIAATLSAQRAAGAVAGFERLSLSLRLSNAAISCVAYIGKMFWPVGLVPYYPYRESLSLVAVVSSAGFLAIVTIAVFAAARRAPYATVGWLWYLGTLVPVIGIVQVGGHAMADRFTYVPLIGLFIAVVWLAHDVLQRQSVAGVAQAVAAAAIVTAASVVTFAQVPHWRDGVALWQHTIRVMPANARAHANLGVALARDGDVAGAVEHYEESLRLAPSAEAHNNLALALIAQGRKHEAVLHAYQAVELKPDYANAHSNLAGLLADLGRVADASQHYARAVELQPDHVRARVGLALTLRDTGRAVEAIPHIREAIRLDPRNAQWHYVAGLVLLDAQQPREAQLELEAALRLDPTHRAAREALDAIRRP